MIFWKNKGKTEHTPRRMSWGSVFLSLLKIANILAIIAMASVGFIDRINPTEHPLWASIGLGFPVLLAINLAFLVIWIFIRPKMLWLPVLGLLICYSPIRKYTPFNKPKEHPHGSIKVLSYNVYMFAPWDLEKGKSNPIVDYIINSKADIVCLQESDAREAGGELIEKRLKDAYPHHDFVKITDSGGQHMMLLTKFPIIRKERIEYKSAGNISYAYIIDYKGTEVLVVNNHFESNHLSEEDKQSYKNIVKSPLETKDTERASFRLLTKLGEAAAIRSPQVEKVAAYVKTYMDRHVPVILCGDFNDSPISFAHHTLEKQLTDCYIASGNGPGISYHKNGMYFRIDHIFCSDDFEPFEAKVDDKIDNSDHYPIYTWLKYRPKP